MARHPDAPSCLVLDGPRATLADQFALFTGLSVAAASVLVDWHIERGEN